MITATQFSLIACLGSYATLYFTLVHRFSIGLGSGLFPGHSNTEILWVFFRNSVTRNAILNEDRAAVDVHVLLFEQLHVRGSIHSGVRRNELQNSSATIRLTKSFSSEGVSLSKRLPRDRLMCIWRGTNCCMVHFLPLSESPMAMTSGKVQFLFSSSLMWYSCQPVGLQSRFFVETSRNSAGTYCVQ